jgi:hypothetical protein
MMDITMGDMGCSIDGCHFDWSLGDVFREDSEDGEIGVALNIFYIPTVASRTLTLKSHTGRNCLVSDP